MMRLITILGGALLLLAACRKDQGEALFDLNYPPRSFTLAAGANPGLAQVFTFNNQPTLFQSFLNNSGHTADEVEGIQSRFARLSSEDGFDLGFLTGVSVRICPVTQDECTFADEVFYRDDLFRRNISVINLDPGLADKKELLSGNLYKMEVLLFLGDVSPYAVDFRLEYGFTAYKK
ncbi:MAG: hypothetical protein R2795_08150 [Saprospiraceae bacterium]